MQEPLEKTIERIKKMEDYFEKLSAIPEAALPAGLTRGVLSQDGLYNLLSELKRFCD